MRVVPIAGGVAARATRAPRAAWAGWLLVALAGVLAVLALRSAAAAAAAAAPSVCALRDLFGLATARPAASPARAWRSPTATGAARSRCTRARWRWRRNCSWAGSPAGAWLAGALRSRPDRWIPHVVALDVAALVLLWALRAATGALPG